MLFSDALHRTCRTSFALPLAAPDNFASAAFVAVGDPRGHLATWREALGNASREIRQAAYVPHVTLGLYRRQVSAQVVRQRLSGIEAPPVSLWMDSLHYATFDARFQSSPLENHYQLVPEA